MQVREEATSLYSPHSRAHPHPQEAPSPQGKSHQPISPMLARSWVGRGGPESSHALGSNRQGCKPHGHAPGHMRKSSEQHAPTQALPAQLPRPQPPGEPVARTGLWSVVCSLPAGSRRSNPQENMVADEGCECQDPSHTQVPPAPPLTQAGQTAGPQEPGLHGDAVGRGGGQCVCVRCAIPLSPWALLDYSPALLLPFPSLTSGLKAPPAEPRRFLFPCPEHCPADFHLVLRSKPPILCPFLGVPHHPECLLPLRCTRFSV